MNEQSRFVAARKALWLKMLRPAPRVGALAVSKKSNDKRQEICKLLKHHGSIDVSHASEKDRSPREILPLPRSGTGSGQGRAD
jgi:hypothetical protein